MSIPTCFGPWLGSSGRGLYRALCLLALALVPVIAGCDFDDSDTVIATDDIPPRIPTGVRSITGDGEVQLVWNPNTEEDLAGYNVYWSEAPAGPYQFIASTTIPRYLDRDVDNGVTYYYAVTAFDLSRNESELSRELVHDTPRPEGRDLVLWNSSGPSWELSGYDFDHYVRRPWSSVDTDIFFLFDGRQFLMVGADDMTDLQDAGFTELENLDWAPPAGWSPDHRVTLIEGHSYYVWTRDDHYAKFRVTDLTTERVIIDWAFQIDKSNPELVRNR